MVFSPFFKKKGYFIRWYDDYKSQKWEEGPLRGGKRHGLWTGFYPNGQKHYEGTYKNGLRHGLWTEKSVLSEYIVQWSKGTYKNGKKVGLWNEWDIDGCREVGIYKAGKREGHWIGFFTDLIRGDIYRSSVTRFSPPEVFQWIGSSYKEWEVNYKAGKEHGLFTSWYRDGKKEFRGTMEAGEMKGVWTYWYRNGQKEKEGEYECTHQEVGVWTYWDQEGNFRKTETWKPRRKR